MTATPETQTPTEPRCVRCGQTGHLSKDCPWPRGSARPRPDKYLPASLACAHFTRDRLMELFAYDPTSGVLMNRAKGAQVTSTGSHGYLWVWAGGAALLVHRIAWRLMTNEWPTGMLDHIDGNRTNNAWANLRDTDSSRNAQNMHKAMRTSRTGVLGVFPGDKRWGKPYRAGIEVDGRKRNLGVFDTLEEARAAYLDAKAQLHPTADIVRSKQ